MDDNEKTKNQKSRYEAARKALIFWTLFIGVGAVGGAACMLADPSGKALGMDAMLPYFQVLPFSDRLFSDFVFSGIALLLVNGITNLTAAVLLLKKQKFGVILGGAFGVTLMLWICIQFCIFPPNFMSTAYFVFGFLQAVTGYTAWVFLRQEAFFVNEAEYRNVGKDPRRLVAYFSRMGYVRKIALEEADRTGADIYEIKATERTEGTLGFWWCGRFGMHGWDMPIEPVKIDLKKYELVTVCSPIWVFSIASPVRSFLSVARGKIKNVNYILVHYTNGKYIRAADEADALLGIKRKSLINVRCRQGSFKHEGERVR